MTLLIKFMNNKNEDRELLKKLLGAVPNSWIVENDNLQHSPINYASLQRNPIFRMTPFNHLPNVIEISKKISLLLFWRPSHGV